MRVNPLEGLLDSPASAGSGKSVRDTVKDVGPSVPFFSVRRCAGGWEYIRLRVSPDLTKVLSVEKSVPDMKAVCCERFKINVGKYWQDEENHG